MSIYRQIYEQYYGSIPKESNGRSYEIHHKNGDPTDNRPENLIAVTIQEHYDIHLRQGDYAACLLIAARMEITPTEKSRLMILENKKRVREGTHPFLNKQLQKELNRRAYADGKHPFVGGIMGGEVQRRRVENGTHHFLGGKINKRRVAEGTHHFLGDKNPSHARLRAGTHNFQKEYICSHCGKAGRGPGMIHHFRICEKKVKGVE